MKFKLVMTLLFASSLFGFSQTNPQQIKSQPSDTTNSNLLEMLESLKNDPAFQQRMSSIAEGFFSGMVPTPGSILHTSLPKFSLKTLKKKRITSEDLLGKVTFIHIWDLECEDCPQEIPDLNKLKSNLQGQDIIFLSLPIAETKALKQYLKQHPFDFEHIPEAFSLIEKISFIPQNILVDKHGIIRYVINNPFDNMLEVKPTDWHLVQEQIQSLLIE